MIRHGVRMYAFDLQDWFRWVFWCGVFCWWLQGYVNR